MKNELASVRPFKVKDAPEILRIYNEIYGRHYKFKDLESVEKLADWNYKARSLIMNDRAVGVYYISY
ncbi:hypothetical protein GF352_03060, partial [archaeon]|nr:hypothetical protein [archaeon]